jgi:hypothetical protein
MERKFSYEGIHYLRVIMSQFAGIVCILFFTAFMGIFVFGFTKMRVPSDVSVIDDPRITVICFILSFLVVSWVIGFTFINFYPTIWLNDDGIKISAFIFFKFYIPWNEVIDIRQVNFWGLSLVRVKKITFFHRLYSWYYSYSLYPGFVIGNGIGNRVILIEEIKKKVYTKYNQ